MANGDPTALSKVIRDVGFPAAIALILLAALLGWIPSPMLTAHARIDSLLKDHTKEDGTRTYLLRRICQNSSSTKEESRQCLQDSVVSVP